MKKITLFTLTIFLFIISTMQVFSNEKDPFKEKKRKLSFSEKPAFPLIINEIHSKGDQNNPDFVELYNKSDSAFLMEKGKWFITSTPGKKVNYFMLPEMTISPRGFYVIQCDGSGLGSHANFKLSKRDTVVIYYLKKNKFHKIESKVWTFHSAGKSKGRFPDGGTKWKDDDSLKPTPGKSNKNSGLYFDLSRLIVLPANFSKMIFGAILVSLLSLILTLVYRYTYSGKDYNPSFVQAFFLIAILLGFIMQIIGNSLARAFGMMGAVSIARFRTKVEDAKDTSFVLFSIGIGMAGGLGHYVLAMFMTFFTSMIAILFYWFRRFFQPPHTDILQSLTLEVTDYLETKEMLEKTLDGQNVHHLLVNLEKKDHAKLTYNIRFKRKLGAHELAATLEEALGERMISVRWGAPLKTTGSISM